MGYYIHRAIGYGMPWKQFVDLCLLEPSNDANASLSERLRQTFENLTPDDMTVPKGERWSGKPGDPPIVSTSLLARTFRFDKSHVPEIGRATELFEIARNPDYEHDIIFFPNLIYAGAWCRSSNAIDYAFETFGLDAEISDPRDFTKYIRFGHHPYQDYLMTQEGKPVPHYPYWYLDTELDLVGAVPAEIRWYLTKHRILSEEGVSHLRPVIAQWWA